MGLKVKKWLPKSDYPGGIHFLMYYNLLYFLLIGFMGILSFVLIFMKGSEFILIFFVLSVFGILFYLSYFAFLKKHLWTRKFWSLFSALGIVVFSINLFNEIAFFDMIFLLLNLVGFYYAFFDEKVLKFFR